MFNNDKPFYFLVFVVAVVYYSTVTAWWGGGILVSCSPNIFRLKLVNMHPKILGVTLFVVPGSLCNDN